VFADILADIIANHATLSGLYHVSSDPITKLDLLSLIKDRVGKDIEIEPEEEFSIDRSLDSTKFRKVTGFSPLPWSEMVDRMFSDPTPYNLFR
jgi:dTDP-4-dehydrorhamnose reductase